MISKDDIALGIIKRYTQAEGERGTWESHWEEIAKRVLPNYSGTFTNRGMGTDGSKRTEEMLDATAALALQKFAAFMESMNTPRNSTWHRLRPMDSVLRRNNSALRWYDDATEVLFRYRQAPRANYQSQQHEVYTGLGAFGTGALLTDALRFPGERGLRYKSIHLGNIYFLENHQGIIDTAMRKFDLTARQAMQQFKPDELPDDIKTAAADPGKCEGKFWFIHCIRPAAEEEGYDPNRRDHKGMRYSSYYVAIAGKKVVAEGGYNTFPYAISRYYTTPDERVYGRSPAMLALPAIKVLNEEKRTLLKQGHRAVDPVLLAHDDGVVDTFSLTPGFINYGGVSAEGRPLVHALPVGNIAIGKELMDDERFVINDAFLVTLFQILVETPQMTATEVLERSREKGALLSPTMGRMQSEFFGPMIERELDVLAIQGLLPEMPPIVRQAKAEYEAIYDSPLSRAQRAEQATGLLRTIDWTREYIAVTQDPRPLDWINWDAAMPDLLDIQAVPARWMNDMKMVQAIRDGRAQAAQQAQAIEALPAAAGAMKALGPQNAA